MKPYGKLEKAFTVELNKWIEYANPRDFGLPAETPSMEPLACYITTGDARMKTRWLVEQYDKIIPQLATTPEYQAAVQRVRDKASAFFDLLVALKKDAAYLECEYETIDGQPTIKCRRVKTRRGGRL